MTRREALRAGLLGTAALLLGGHEQRDARETVPPRVKELFRAQGDPKFGAMEIDHRYDPSPLNYHFVGEVISEDDTGTGGPLQIIEGVDKQPGSLIGVSFDYNNWYQQFLKQKMGKELVRRPKDQEGQDVFFDLSKTAVIETLRHDGTAEVKITIAVKDVSLFVSEMGNNPNDSNNNFFTGKPVAGYNVNELMTDSKSIDKNMGRATGTLEIHYINEKGLGQPIPDLLAVAVGRVPGIKQTFFKMMVRGQALARERSKFKPGTPLQIEVEALGQEEEIKDPKTGKIKREFVTKYDKILMRKK
jgi:hypothetical protein